MNYITGIHHITAIAGDPQKNIDFYAGILGLKFIKKTVNFDDPQTYHFYYGDKNGNPGTIMTFFPWGVHGFKGKRGIGQVGTISFSVPLTSINFWEERLNKKNIEFAGPLNRFNEQVLIFEDHDEFEIEIVGSDEEQRPGYSSPGIPAEHSIRGFWGAAIWHGNIEPTKGFAENFFGFKMIKETTNRIRLSAGNGVPGKYIDLLKLPEREKGIMGVGAIHHIAFRVDNEQLQIRIRKELDKNNFNVTPVIDRNYFKSIYFHEPGNVLFEIATDPPGFLIDEPTGSLTSSLKLPSWYESIRKEIEDSLQPVIIPEQ